MLAMKGNSFFFSGFKVVLLVAAPTSLECFTFFLLGPSDLDDSANLCLKILFQKKYQL